MKHFMQLFVFCSLFICVFQPISAAAAENIKPVKYVFLFIGDGLSIPQRMMAEEFSVKTSKGKLFINSMPYQAVTTTRSSSSFITDSAASGTAIACGEKTNNGYIGVNSKGKRLESIAEVAKKSGRKVGIISSVTINHATPASFYAHNISRGNYYNLALDLIESDFDYFGGGGAAKADDKKNRAYKGNIYELAAKAGYTVAQGRKAVEAVRPGTPKVFSVGATGSLAYAIDRKENDMKLADFVAQSIKMLDNDKGFFIMAEGGMIDWVCHSNDAGTTLREIIDFDEAVKVAFEFAQKHPDETLIVVTGDHETGGLTLGFAGTGYQSYIENLKFQKCSIYAFNNKIAQLQKKSAVVPFDAAKKIITANFGLLFSDSKESVGLKLSKNEEQALLNAFNAQFPDGNYKKSSILAIETIRIFNNKCALAWTSTAHTALPVMTTAWGKNASLFSNHIDNTDIAILLKLVVR